MTHQTSVAPNPGARNEPIRRWLTNGIGTAIVEGDVVALDVATVNAISRENTHVREPIAADVISGVGLVALQAIPIGGTGWFLEEGEYWCKTVAASGGVVGGNLAMTIGAGNKYLTDAAATQKVVGKVKLIRDVTATSPTFGKALVEFNGRYGYGNLA